MSGEHGQEVWVAIPGWPHYQRSSHGRVRSLDHSVPTAHGGRRFVRGRILSVVEPQRGPRAGGGGRRVTLSDGERKATLYLDRLPDVEFAQ